MKLSVAALRDGQTTPPTLAILLPAIVAVAVGVPSIDGTYIRDDWDYVENNPHVACAATPRDVLRSPFPPLQKFGLYRPVTTLSLRLDYVIGSSFGRPEIALHATNLILAGLAAALAAALAMQLVKPTAYASAATTAGLLAGLLFAVHPARTEATCWISGRAENLMTVFSLLCLLLASGPERLGRMVLAALCAVLSALSKEQGFVLAALVPIVAPPTTGKRFVQFMVVTGALGLAFVERFRSLQSLSLNPALFAFDDVSLSARVPQGLALFADYVRVAFWPHPLLFEYDRLALRATSWSDPRVLGGVAAMGACVAAIGSARWFPILAAAAGVFLLPLTPVLGVVMPIGEDFAERFLALPVAGLAIGAGALAARGRAPGILVAILVAAVAGFVSTQRAADYRSERSLYEALHARAPAMPAANALLASNMIQRHAAAPNVEPDLAQRAERMLREAVVADPGYLPARVALATLETQRRIAIKDKPTPASFDLMVETARRFPNQPMVHRLLGLAYRDAGHWEAARQQFHDELRVMPADFVAARELARVYETAGLRADADKVMADIRAVWKKHWERFPGFAPVAITYASTLSDSGRDLDGAREVLRRSAAEACRDSDRQKIQAALGALGG